jgi:hypothetical protein
MTINIETDLKEVLNKFERIMLRKNKRDRLQFKVSDRASSSQVRINS